MKTIIGAHMSVAGGFYKAYDEALAVGGDALQIFMKSPMQGKLRAITKEEVDLVKASPGYPTIKASTIHASYLINFAKPLTLESYQMRSLIEDVVSAEAIGALGAVLHMGKTLEQDPKNAEKTFIENIEQALEATKGSRAHIILENTAGQGTEMGSTLSSYGEIFQKLKKHTRISSCIDTAHLFGGGHDLSNTKSAEAVADDVEREVGWERVACVHLNDSKKPVGSHVDRHQDIGFGEIGDEGLRAFVNRIKTFRPDMPFILETPTEHASYNEQIEKVRGW